MKILQGNFGQCFFCDNMDENYGLPILPPKSWDLCLTDPPYNLDYDGSIQINKNMDKKIFYNDTVKNYEDFSKKWFKLTMEKVKTLIFTPGNKNIFLWGKIELPIDYAFNYKVNCCSRSSLFRFYRGEPILFYGKFRHQLDYYSNVFENYIDNGFLDTSKFIHPSPKSLKLWKELIIRTKPTSVIDPFLGSGTTAQVCEHLGIPWLGYEIMEEYAPDIEKRIKKGIVEHSRYNPPKKRSQLSLESFQETIHTVSNDRR